jgi:hypothetical protein
MEDEGAFSSSILQLPSTERSVSDMERHSWLKSGSRLEEGGNLEILSAQEIQLLKPAR